VVSPAGAPIPSASGGLLGLGCVGDPRLLAQRCTVHPSLSRFRFSGGVDEAAVAAALWNKSFWSRPRLGGVTSGAGEGPVKAESDGAAGLAAARSRLLLGDSDVGVPSSMLLPGLVLVLVLLYRGMVLGFEDVWWVDWHLGFGACQRWVPVLGRSNLGCVPGRCASSVRSCCGLCQSLCAMKLFPALVSLLFVSFSGGGLPTDGARRRRRLESGASTKGPLGVFVIFLLLRDLRARFGGLPSLLYASSRSLYLYCLLYGGMV